MTTAPPPVRPRRPGDPVPNVLGMRLAHRSMLRDADRLADVAERLAAGSAAVDHRRAAAVAAYVGDWADSVCSHHTVEDELLWPVLVASAGPHVDLSELTDDHASLEPALARLRAAGDAVRARPGEDTAAALAVELGELRDALREHVAEEEGAVLPVLERYVSVRDWQRVEQAVARRARLSFELPRAAAVLTAEEQAALAWRERLLLRLGSALLGPGARRRERPVFG